MNGDILKVVSLDEIETKLGEILETMQHDMLEKARAHRDSHTYNATTYEEFVETINNKPGFVRAMWCGDQACEDKIKEDTTATRDRKSTRLNSSHPNPSRMPSSA